MMKTSILTHADGDGICAGAIALSRFPGSKVFFTKPVSLLRDLGRTEADRIVICDIALTRRDFRDIIKYFREKKSEILIFDHHPLPAPDRKVLKDSVGLYVTGKASSSELIYRYYQDDLPRERVWISLYGAIADYEDNTEFVEARLRNWDARAIYLESSSIVMAIKQRDFDSYDEKRRIVEALAAGKNPTDVPGLIRAASRAVNEEFGVYEKVKKYARRSGHVGYVKDAPLFGFRGPSALFSATATNSRVGMAVHNREDHLDITIRTRDYSIPLNTVADLASSHVGGSGGGHHNAAGCRIPSGTFKRFLWKANRIIKERYVK